MSDMSLKLPWYRQPLVWLVISIPLSAVLAGIVTIYLAVTTDDGLVVDDYYKQGLAINRQIERDQTATRLQLSADIEIDTATGFVKLMFDKGRLDAYPLTLTLGLRHATQQQQDNFITLQHGIDNQYVGAVSRDGGQGIRTGVWHVEISRAKDGETDAWRLSRRVWLEGFTRVQLLPEAEQASAASEQVK